MLEKMIYVMRNLAVYPENMKKNLEETRGLIYSQRVLLALVAKGVSREDAYKIVQRDALKVWDGTEDFRVLLEKDPEVTEVLKPDELAPLFDAAYYLRHVDEIFSRRP
jgi:adenylosuccinate lyase